MATEPTFDNAGLAGTDPTSPGWYPDPDPGYREGWERYWDGGAWGPPGDRRPVGAAAASVVADPRSSAKVHLWYLLACMLPFTLSVLLPKIPWDAAPETGSASMWQGVMGQVFLAGFIPWLIGVAGAAAGRGRFEEQRRLRFGPAGAWNAAAWTVAVILFLGGTSAVLFMLAMIGALGGGIGL